MGVGVVEDFTALEDEKKRRTYDIPDVLVCLPTVLFAVIPEEVARPEYRPRKSVRNPSAS